MPQVDSPRLPNFRKPPVIEVALSIQFDPIKELGVARLGLLWGAFRDKFPRCEEHAALSPMDEKFAASPTAPPIRFEIASETPPVRLWFVSENGAELMQVQSDRIARNWRKQKAEDVYPRYSALRDSFREEYKIIENFLERENLPPIKPTRWEVTYVNHVAAGQGWEKFGELSKVIGPLKDSYSDSFLSNLEEASLRLSYLIPGPEGAPFGRLRISAQPVYRKSDKKPLFDISMVARGLIRGDGIDGILASLEIGHQWIVRGFASVTTPEMHAIWEKYNDD